MAVATSPSADTLSGNDESKQALATEIDSNLREAIKAQSAFNKEAKEDVEFALGEQWSKEDRQKLKEEGRPCLTFNRINPIINLVTGHLQQNTARLMVAPEGGEDKPFSTSIDKIIQYVVKRSKLDWYSPYLFAGGERAGRVWLEFYLDYDEEPVFGELKCNYLGPFKIYKDPNSNAYDLSDCQYVFKVAKLSKGTLKNLYPEQEKVLDDIEMDSGISGIEGSVTQEGDKDNYGADKGEKGEPGTSEGSGDSLLLSTVEYWRKKRVVKYCLYDAGTGNSEEFKTKDEAEARKAEIEAKAFQDAQVSAGQGMMKTALQQQAVGMPTELDISKEPMPTPQMMESMPKIIIQKRRAFEMHFAVKIAGKVIIDEISAFEPHYSGFPFFQYIANWSPEAETEELKVQSLVRCMKDAQREINKARSQYLHILNTSANSGWIGDNDALTQDEKVELKTFGSTPGLTVWKKPGSQLERIHPVEPSLATQVREKAAADNIKDVSGINADLLSVDNSAQPSGRAIALRIRQAITILEPSFSNFRYTKELIGNFLFAIIPALFDTSRMKRILGEQFMRETEIDEGHLRAYLYVIREGKYDVRIAEQGFTRSMREETFDNLMTLVEKGFPLPPDVVLEFMNLPDQKEVINKVTAYQAQQAQMAQAQAQTKGAKTA